MSPWHLENTPRFGPSDTVLSPNAAMVYSACQISVPHKKLKLTQAKNPSLTRRYDHGPKGPKANLVVKLGSSSREVLMT